MPSNSMTKQATPASTLRSFLAALAPRTEKLARAIRAALRKRFPTANELAYQYPDSLVIAYSPTESGIDGVVSFAARADGVRLYFMNGPTLHDPKKLLLGTGKQVRYVQLETVSRLSHPDVKALIAAAVAKSKLPLPAKGKGELIIKSGGKKKPARKATKGRRA